MIDFSEVPAEKLNLFLATMLGWRFFWEERGGYDYFLSYPPGEIVPVRKNATLVPADPADYRYGSHIFPEGMRDHIAFDRARNFETLLRRMTEKGFYPAMTYDEGEYEFDFQQGVVSVGSAKGLSPFVAASRAAVLALYREASPETRTILAI